MKKIIAVLSLVFFLYVILSGCDDRTDKAKMVHKAMYHVSNKLEKQYQLRYIGMIEGADAQFYKEIGIEFMVFRIITKDEGRKMLVEGVEELLHELNSNPQLEPYLQPYPFTVANVQISIFSYHPDRTKAYYPDIISFTAYSGKVRYVTDSPQPQYKYKQFTEEEESYEEAVEIVHAQKAL